MLCFHTIILGHSRLFLQNSYNYIKKKHIFFYAGVSDKKTCTWAKTGLAVPAIDREPVN